MAPDHRTLLTWSQRTGEGTAAHDDFFVRFIMRTRGAVSLMDGDHIIEIDYQPHATVPTYWIRYSGEPGRRMTGLEIARAQWKLEAMARGGRAGFQSRMP